MEDVAMLGLAVDSGPVDRGRRSLREFEAQSSRTERSVLATERATKLLVRAMGLIGTVLSVQHLIQMTSAWTDLNSRVANVVGSHEAAAAAMKRIDEMARRTYSSLNQTAETFLLNATALRELGYSTDATFDFVESLNNALVVSGAKGQRAEQVMNALSKAIGLGKLSGDNLNTVLATGGRVAEALADGLGVSTLQLRKLGSEGKLTTSKVIEALTSQLEKLREEADAMPATIEDAFTLMGNAILRTVGQIDQFVGGSSAVAEAIITIGDNIDVVIPIIGGLAGVTTAMMIPALASATLAVIAFAASPIGILAITIGGVAAALTYMWNEQRLAAQAAEQHSAALTTNATQIEAAKTASSEFRAELRKNIEVQLAAAEAALAEAEAQRKAAMTRWATGSLFDTVLSGQAWDFIVNGNEPDAPQRAAVDAASQRIADLRKQLTELDTIISTVSPGSSDKPTIPTDPTKDQIKAAKAYDELVKSTKARTAALEAEAAALGLTAVQSQSLLNLQGLIADAEKTGIEMTEPRIQQIIELSDALTNAELTLEGLHITMENRSPWQVMADEVQHLNDLMEKGKITASDYWAEIGKSAETMMGVYASAATGIIGQAEKLTDALGLQGRQAFEAQKAISIANAVVAGGEAIVKSYNWGTTLGGPIGGALAAGLAAAATAAQIASIASTTYQSKTLPSRGAGASAAPAAPVAQQGSSINLTIRGSGMMSVDEFAEQLTKGIADGGHQSLINVIRAA